MPSSIVGQYPAILTNVAQEFNGLWNFVVNIPLNIIGDTLKSVMNGFPPLPGK